MSYRLFLDDIRIPIDCRRYMADRAGDLFVEYFADWVVVRSFQEFKNAIGNRGMPFLISFDHDLVLGGIAPENVEGYKGMETDNTGWHCAEWLVGYLEAGNQGLPSWIIHSVNKIGTQHIEKMLEGYSKKYFSKSIS